MAEKDPDPIEIRLDLEGEIKRKFEARKKETGFKQNSALMIHLINVSHRHQQK